MKVTFCFGSLKIAAQFNESKTARLIYDSLPFHSAVNLWGDEIYFEIPLALPAEKATINIQIGDIAYWPQGACLCLFFGRTPASVDERPRPASPVEVVGSFSAVPSKLRKVKSGTRVSIEKVSMDR